jgi:hypothetical protein
LTKGAKNMKTRVEGVNEVQKNLEKIRNKAKEIEGSNQVPLTELLPDSFIKNYTNFETTQDFVDACEKLLDVDFLSIDENDEKFNHMIKEKTSFDNWNGMIGEATTQWVGKKLGFK